MAATVLCGGVAYYNLGAIFRLTQGIGKRVHGETAPDPLLDFGISWRSKSVAGKRPAQLMIDLFKDHSSAESGCRDWTTSQNSGDAEGNRGSLRSILDYHSS